MACFAPRLPELAPWITAVWVREPGRAPAHARECVLPSGAMHLSLRLVALMPMRYRARTPGSRRLE